MRSRAAFGLTLAGVLAIGGIGCDGKLSENKKQQYQTKNISGKIINLDEDSFVLDIGGNFEFEHFRIESPDGRVYKLIFPGPSNYNVGDDVDFTYKIQNRISYLDLATLANPEFRRGYPNQDGFFEVDGIIQR